MLSIISPKTPYTNNHSFSLKLNSAHKTKQKKLPLLKLQTLFIGLAAAAVATTFTYCTSTGDIRLRLPTSIASLSHARVQMYKTTIGGVGKHTNPSNSLLPR